MRRTQGTNNEAMSTEDFLREIVFKNGGRGGEMDFRRGMGMPVGDRVAQGRSTGWNEADPRDDIGQFTFKEGGGTEQRKAFNTLIGTAEQRRETPEQTAERLLYPEKPLEKLYGSYRGRKGGYYQNEPVIFQAETEAPHPWLYTITGALTENKGLLGTIGSKSSRAGQV